MNQDWDFSDKEIERKPSREMKKIRKGFIMFLIFHSEMLYFLSSKNLKFNKSECQLPKYFGCNRLHFLHSLRYATSKHDSLMIQLKINSNNNNNEDAPFILFYFSFGKFSLSLILF